MVSRESKSLEQLAAEQVRIAELRVEIRSLCSRVPGSVLAGSVQTAIAWKKEAHAAYSLADSKSPTLEKLTNAANSLRMYTRVTA